MITNIKDHWNTVYSSNPDDQLGWYEPEPQVSLDLINHCSLSKHDPILDVGSGSSLLVDHLIKQRYGDSFVPIFRQYGDTLQAKAFPFLAQMPEEFNVVPWTS